MTRNEMMARMFIELSDEDNKGCFMKYVPEEKTYIIQTGMMIEGDEWICLAMQDENKEWHIAYQEEGRIMDDSVVETG